MTLAMDILKDIVAKNPKLTDDVLVSFNSWGDFAMGILFIYWIISPDDILEAQTEVNMAILSKFNAAGLDFAYPTALQYNKDLN